MLHSEAEVWNVTTSLSVYAVVRNGNRSLDMTETTLVILFGKTGGNANIRWGISRHGWHGVKVSQ